MSSAENLPIFAPDRAAVVGSAMSAFTRFCAARTGRDFVDYRALHAFSCGELERFWRLFLEWSGLSWEGGAEPVCTDHRCEEAVFFPHLRLSYAQALLALDSAEASIAPALTACHSNGRSERLTRAELRDRAARLAVALRRFGLRPGDRVVAVVANNAEAVIAALAVLALGATFSSASPEMGPVAIVSRFGQLAPSLLMVTLGLERVAAQLVEIVAALPSLEAIVALDAGAAPVGLAPTLLRLSNLLAQHRGEDFDWPPFPFNHPAFILFSSGTTGRPKCLMHGAGGTLLEHVKEHRLHCDLRRGDKLFFQTSCAWMMWNWQLSALASGVEIVLYDGPIDEPATLWKLVARERVTAFGTNPAYLQICEEAGLRPSGALDLRALRVMFSTGSILRDRQFRWIRDAVKPLPVQSISGGTDIIGCFLLGNPNLAVHAGEIQCCSLGMDVRAEGATTQSPVGELVCHTPFPSRPLGLYGDHDGRRFHDTYFRQHPGVWTHGDFIEFTAEGSARLHGRTDDVLNVRGVRIGPAEIYRILADIPEISEALAVEQRAPAEPGGSRMVMLVVLRPGRLLDGPLSLRIKKELARRGSPAHVPEIIAQVPELPRTYSGKRSEQAARAAVNGDEVANLAALANPGCIEGLRRHPALALAGAAARALPPEAPFEEQLRAIWEEIFRVAPIGLDDNFFDLGGRSLLAFEMTTRIRERLGRELPATTLLHAPTITALAAVLREDREPPRFSCVVPVKLGGRDAPLFIVHGFAGNPFELLKIAWAIDTDRPIYALQARGLDPQQEPHRRIEEMAEHYIGEIGAVQPNGPYWLSGFSSGGLIAYEMARQLRQRGQRIAFVGLLDTLVGERNFPVAPRIGLALFRAAWLGRKVWQLPRDDKLPYLEHIVLLAVDARTRWRGWHSVRRSTQEERLPAHFLRVRDCGWLAFEAYRPNAFPGTVTFFRAMRPYPLAPDPLPVWRRVAGTVEIYDVPGTHESFIEEPNVAVLGNLMRRCLERGAAQLNEGELFRFDANAGR